MRDDRPAGFASVRMLLDSYLRFRLLEFLRHFRIAVVFGVEIYDGDTNPMFHFAFAQIVQMGTLPMTILYKVIGSATCTIWANAK